MDTSFLEEQIRHLRMAMFHQTNTTKLLLGKQLSWSVKTRHIDKLTDAEFSVFSQFGDDGIIQYLISKLNINQGKFIEFGVENYIESNTRFLLENNNWSGVIIDSNANNVDYIKKSQNYWRYDLKVMCSFVTAENINNLIQDAGFNGDIGLLHIDIDGNDYWLWKAITVVKPVIVIVEYNSLFGVDRSITIPYEPCFSRFNKHHSGLYAGASLKALCHLAGEKGYKFIGTNSAGNNAYFILVEQADNFTSLTCEDGYVLAKFREHRNEDSKLTFTSGVEAIESIRGMPVFNTLTQQLEDF
ncbi:TPA: hypothetical protein P2I01_003037 [Aeromonas salmonicida]|nr:hypothetical protein [Aeromonas salmonicida]